MLKQQIKKMSNEQIRERLMQIDDLLYEDINISYEQANNLWNEQDMLLYELKVVRGLEE